jgi:hypothetical protein
LQEYYRILLGGPAAYGQGDQLRPLLSTQLEFAGSLAGHHVDATEGFLHGVSGFIATVQGIDLLREVHDDRASAVLYDATMPAGQCGSPSSSPTAKASSTPSTCMTTARTI